MPPCPLYGPQSHRLVGTGGGQDGTIGAKGHRGDRPAMTGNSAHDLATVDDPEPDGFVGTGGGKQGVVRLKATAVTGPLWSSSVRTTSPPERPQLHGAIGAARG